MKHENRWWILILTLMLLTSSTLPVYAFGEETELPPLPEWPIIGPVLRWLGVVPKENATPEPDSARVAIPTPTAVIPEQRVTNFAEAKALWQALEAGEQVRIFIADSDINALLNRELEDIPGIHSATWTTETDLTTLTVAADRSFIEEIAGGLPLFIKGEQLKGEITLEVKAVQCRPEITVTKIQVNTRTLPAVETVQALVDKAFDRIWQEDSWFDNHLCVEVVQQTPGETVLEGYRK